MRTAIFAAVVTVHLLQKQQLSRMIFFPFRLYSMRFLLCYLRYLLAVDDSKNTLEEIVKSISNELGNGKINNITREDALIIQDVDAFLYDTLLVMFCFRMSFHSRITVVYHLFFLVCILFMFAQY